MGALWYVGCRIPGLTCPIYKNVPIMPGFKHNNLHKISLRMPDSKVSVADPGFYPCRIPDPTKTTTKEEVDLNILVVLPFLSTKISQIENI
jgi:hypothetical protein